MALRPIFLYKDASEVFSVDIDFEWHSGFSVQQKRKSILSLHNKSLSEGLCKNPIEISSRSDNILGVNLSAFNLMINLNPHTTCSVECAFQAGKIFDNGGPYLDLLKSTSKEAKSDARLKSSGALNGFIADEKLWPITPKTAFYDWLYISALSKSKFAMEILEYDAFTDIEFNPKKSINCQARSVALFCFLMRKGEFDRSMKNTIEFLNMHSKIVKN